MALSTEMVRSELIRKETGATYFQACWQGFFLMLVRHFFQEENSRLNEVDDVVWSCGWLASCLGCVCLSVGLSVCVSSIYAIKCVCGSITK